MTPRIGRTVADYAQECWSTCATDALTTIYRARHPSNPDVDTPVMYLCACVTIAEAVRWAWGTLPVKYEETLFG